MGTCWVYNCTSRPVRVWRPGRGYHYLSPGGSKGVACIPGVPIRLNVCAEDSSSPTDTRWWCYDGEKYYIHYDAHCFRIHHSSILKSSKKNDDNPHFLEEAPAADPPPRRKTFDPDPTPTPRPATKPTPPSATKPDPSPGINYRRAPGINYRRVVDGNSKITTEDMHVPMNWRIVIALLFALCIFLFLVILVFSGKR